MVTLGYKALTSSLQDIGTLVSSTKIQWADAKSLYIKSLPSKTGKNVKINSIEILWSFVERRMRFKILHLSFDAYADDDFGKIQTFRRKCQTISIIYYICCIQWFSAPDNEISTFFCTLVQVYIDIGHEKYKVIYPDLFWCK